MHIVHGHLGYTHTGYEGSVEELERVVLTENLLTRSFAMS